jgi:glucokinase
MPIRFRNDAEAAIVGETCYGAGKPYRRLIGITLGTGIGSAFMKNGRSVTSGAGVPPNGWLYSAPIQDIQADNIFSTRGLMARLHRAGINAPTVADAVKQSGAAGVIAQFGADLGRFLSPFVIDFQAETVLVLGGIANTYPLMADSLNQALPVSAVPGQLGVSAPLLGAADLFFGQGLK